MINDLTSGDVLKLLREVSAPCTLLDLSSILKCPLPVVRGVMDDLLRDGLVEKNHELAECLAYVRKNNLIKDIPDSLDAPVRYMSVNTR